MQLRAPNVATTDPSDFVFVNSLDALKTDVFAGRINPGQITIVRSIVTPATVPAADCNVTPASAQVNCDTAAFSGPIGNYSWVVNADGSVTVTDNVGTDGVDTLRNIERLRFTDVAVPPVPTVPAVVNLTQAAALSAITTAGFTSTVTSANSTTVATGFVISQTPTAGSVATAGSNVAIVVSLGAPPPPAPAGLVLALGFNEASGTTVNDSSPSPKNGTIRGAVRAAGKSGFGNALRFDGVDDWVTIADTTASKLDLTNGMTLEAWVNPTTMSGWETILMKERGITGEGLLSYALYAHDGAPLAGGQARPSGYVRVNPVASTTDTAVRGTAALTLNTWTHIAVTYDGANLRFYVNGVLRGTVARTGNIASNNGAIRIGGNNSSLQEFFRGLIDDVRIYNRALTAAQITADMNAPIQ